MSSRVNRIWTGLWQGYSRRGRIQRYVIVLLLGAILIGGLATMAAVLTPKTYKSGFTLILPGQGPNSSVNIESLGQASSSAASPYGGHSLSPTKNYQNLLMSYRLRSKVAERMDTSVGAIAPPKIKLVNQTKLMFVNVTAGHPLGARQLADTWLEVFDEEINALRMEEQAIREGAYRDAISGFQNDVAQAQARIIAFQTEYGLVSVDQFQDLVRQGDELQRQLDAALIEARVQNVEMGRLARLLNLSPEDAARLMLLQSDPTFVDLRKQLAVGETELAEITNMFGQNHPDRRIKTEEVTGLRSALFRRGQALIGFEAFARLSNDPNMGHTERATLVAQLVTAAAAASGADARAKSLADDLEQTRKKIETLAEPATELAALIRDHKVAETVFASAVARIDANRTDIFASYPLTQTVEMPATPGSPSSLSLKFIIIGAIAGYILFVMGVGLLWIRLPLIRVLLKTI